MTHRRRWTIGLASVAISTLTLAGCAGSASGPQSLPAAQAQPASTSVAGEASASGPVRSTGRFTMWIDSDVNLHHFLLQWSVSLTERGRRVSVPEREEIGRLSEPEQRVWSAAAEHYREEWASESVLFDRELIELRNVMAGTIPAAESAKVLATLDVLESVRPIYREHWWPQHERANRAWVDSVAPVVESMEERVIRRLESIYGVPWPAPSLRIDVSAYAGRVGAYTNVYGPAGAPPPRIPHITISGADPSNAVPHGVEIVFHEPLHSDAMEGAMNSALANAFGDRRPPDRFWHRLQFYNAGEAVREAYAAAGDPSYKTYSEEYGLWSRGAAAARAREVLDLHWQPFLGGEGTREEALAKIAQELAAD